MCGVTLNEYIHTLFDFYPMFVKKRVKLGISLDAFVIISVGELNANKNNRVIISAMETLNSKNIHYISAVLVRSRSSFKCKRIGRVCTTMYISWGTETM